MSRAAAMLLLGTLTLVPSLAGADEIFSCRDADGTWVFGNVEQHRCVGKVKRTGMGHATSQARRPSGTSAAEARGILLAPAAYEAYREHIRDAAAKYHLSEALLLAVMAVESGYRPDAVSVKGAKGLMQLMPDTASDMYVRDVWSPRENIDGGARYLRILANQYGGNLEKTLAAYNAGPEAVKRAGGVPRYQETQDYVRKVLALYEKLKNQNAKG
jgi:soluble lytic murein transglycosylase-like protein